MPELPEGVTPADEDDAVLKIYRGRKPGDWIVKVWADGRIEFADDYDPHEAALIFWAAISEHAPGR